MIVSEKSVDLCCNPLQVYDGREKNERIFLCPHDWCVVVFGCCFMIMLMKLAVIQQGLHKYLLYFTLLHNKRAVAEKWKIIFYRKNVFVSVEAVEA